MRLRFSGALALALLLHLPASAEAQSQAQPRIPLPAAYWSFDVCAPGTGGVLDDSEGTNHLTLHAGATCAAGQYGSAGSFDGVDARAESPATNDPRLNFTNQLTIMAWVKPAHLTSSGQAIVNKWYSPDSYSLAIQADEYAFSVALSNGTNVNVKAPATAGVWTHVAGVFDGSTAKLYLNGVLKQTLSAPGTLRASPQPVRVGNHPSWAAFSGLIDEVRLYRAVLSPGQIGGMAAEPSNVDVRGLHLYSSQWVPQDGSATPSVEQVKYLHDLHRIQSIANLNSVKSILVSTNRQPTDLDRQRRKLTQLKAAAGNHVTWVFRAWPMVPANGAGYHDFIPGEGNYFDHGYRFAQNLRYIFDHILRLKLRDVLIEVANEPNLVREGFVIDGQPSPQAYNDFFRGFYYGTRLMDYPFLLIYAGLSPGETTEERLDSDIWYQDPEVSDTIQSFAARIGAHIYWPQGGRGEEQYQGKYYRKIRDLLIAGGVTPRGIVITEFNAQRTTFPGAEAQAIDVCLWWQEEKADAQAGWWVEQALLYVSNSLDTVEQAEYVVYDSQVDNIRNCQTLPAR
jgi:hypothetical protein